METILTQATAAITGGLAPQAIMICLSLLGIALIIVGFRHIKSIFSGESTQPVWNHDKDERDY